MNNISQEHSLSTQDLAEFEQSVSNIVTECAKSLLGAWQKQKDVSYKELNEPVTRFDIETEFNIRQELVKLIPNAGFLLEEQDNISGGNYTWVIDPIDQTKNFIAQIPVFYIQVALIYDKSPILGVIYNPVSGQLFSASRGNGVKLNGVTLGTLSKKDLSKCLIDIDFGGNDDLEWKTNVLKKLAKSSYRIRMTGGAYLPYITTGGIDGFIVLNQKTKQVDQLPRMILATELGLTVDIITIEGRTIYIAGHSEIIAQIKALL